MTAGTRRRTARCLAAASAAAILSGCPIGLGERCASDLDCRDDLVCLQPPGGGGGICDYPYRAAGEPCTVAAHCEPELTCSSHLMPGARYGVCVEKQPGGEVCSVDRDCISGSCLGPTPEALGTCAP